ncbi:hypothetical protein D3C85_1647210 [compost metagenome]
MTIEQRPLDEVDALALEPAGIRRGKSLLLSIGDIRRNVLLHYIAQDLLPIPRFLEVLIAFVARLVLVQFDNICQIVQFEPDWTAHCKIDQVVVQKRHPRFQAVRHA